MAPFAGKPPFATDLPDSFYADQLKPTPHPKQIVDATALSGPRESAYTAFDSYFTSGNNANSRASGIDNIGQGLVNVSSDDDHSEDDPSHLQNQPPLPNGQAPNKHRALYAAATGNAPPQSPPPSYERGVLASARGTEYTPAPLKPSSTVRTVRQPQPVVRSSADELRFSHHAVPSTPPGVGRSMAQQQQGPPSALLAGGRPAAGGSPAPPRQPRPALLHGQDVIFPPPSPSSHGSLPGTLTPTSRTPQPLPPPQTPITPVFARPRRQPNAISFQEKAVILRGNSEETLLPRGVGGKGDDFWRRFSMVAKENARSNSQKSAWLSKTESGSTSLAKWVWGVGILLLVAIGAGIGFGWYFTHNKPGAQPVAIGGSADEILTTTLSIAVTSASVRPTKVTAAPVPTNTSNNKRAMVTPAHRRAHVSHIGY